MRPTARSSARVGSQRRFRQAGAENLDHAANDSFRYSTYAQSVLSDRDSQIIRTLRQARLMTAGQLGRMHFDDVSSRERRYVLANLCQRRLIRRFPRRVGGVRAGSAGYLYGLDVAGQRQTNGTGPAGGYRLQRPWLPGDQFLAHSLAVSELLVRVTEATRHGDLRLLDFEGEPRCWRRFYGPDGVTTTLKPDAAVRIGGVAYRDHWFIELDRATQPPRVLMRKCVLYRAYWASGQEQTLHGVFPRVLFVVPTAARHDVIANVLGRQPTEAWAIFGVCQFDEVVARLRHGAHR